MKNKKIIVNILIMIIGGGFLVGLYFIFNIFSNTGKEVKIIDEDLYQYFTGIKQEYSGKIEISEQENEDALKLEDGTTVLLDSTPMFYKNSYKLILPEQMEAVYLNTGKSYKTEKYSFLNYQSEITYIQKDSNSNGRSLEKAFLYDGNDVYVFVEKTKLQVGENQYELSPLSYAIVTYRQSIDIYNYETDEYILIDDEELTKDVKATTDEGKYTINLSVDSVKSGESEKLLMKNIDSLEKLEY